jgi:hypothetical protein
VGGPADVSAAQRDLREAWAAKAVVTAAVVQRRSRWVTASVAVFTLSVLSWIAGPGPANILVVVFSALFVLASLAVGSPRWAGLVATRARLLGQPARAVRWFVAVTALAMVALGYLINVVCVTLLHDTCPIAGLITGLVLSFAGPRFARWWFRPAANLG